MKQHLNNGQEYLMVEVPEGIKSIAIWEVENNLTSLGKIGDIILTGSLAKGEIFHTKLPSGQWQILFLASEATEEQAGEVCEKIVVKPKFVGDKSQTFYYDYGHRFYIMKFATESLRSLLSSHGMEGETLFIKRVK